MNSSSASPSNRISHILSTLNKYKLLWILPMILGMLLAAVYAFALRSETWSAKQSLIVRDDLLGQSFKPGQFESLDTMKSAQETIFEIARKPQVIRNTLQQLGPPSTGFLGLGGGDYPSEEVIEQMQGSISFSAPNGAEFGQTEVIILNTKSGSRVRAKELTEILIGEIISKVSEVRHQKFQSMEAEIQQTCDAAEEALEATKVKLRKMDQQLGQDAGGMVAMGESAFRDDPISREIAQLNLERRVVQSEVDRTFGMLQSLKTAKQNPEAIVNISSDLSGRQPALDALKREIVQQKGAYALLSGRYTNVHPAVVSARDGIIVMRDQIRLELDNAESDTTEQLGIKTAKLDRLDADIVNLKKRLVALSEKRADSITLFADIKKRTETLNNAQSNLSEIHGLGSSENTGLLTKVDEVQVSTRPDGLGNKAIILCGGLGGLMLGMGLVMLLAPPPSDPVARQGSRSPQSQSPNNLGPNHDPIPTHDPAGPALADIGLAKARSGLAASTDVLRDLMKLKPKDKRTAAEEKTAEIESQKIIDGRLNRAKDLKKPGAALGAAPEPVETPSVESHSIPEPSAAKPKPANPFSRKEIETSKAKVATGAKIVPASSNPLRKTSQPVVPSALVGAAATLSALDKNVTSQVEIPDVNPDEQSGAINKMVDEAFEGELKSPSRSESQTIQLDTLAKAIGGGSAAALATQQLESDSPKAPPKRGAQIKPRSANIRPVDLARQADGDEFKRVSPDQETVGAKAKASQPPAVSTGPSVNPFIKERVANTVKPPLSDDSSVVPVPDQIRKLSDSIANFAMPVKSQSGSKKETF